MVGADAPPNAAVSATRWPRSESLPSGTSERCACGGRASFTAGTIWTLPPTQSRPKSAGERRWRRSRAQCALPSAYAARASFRASPLGFAALAH
jgi:hypothetical protein